MDSDPILKYEPVLLKNMVQPGYTGSLADYERAGGYQAIRKVLGKLSPPDVTNLVKRSGLRGRGGAGGHYHGMGRLGLHGEAQPIRSMCLRPFVIAGGQRRPHLPG